MTVETSDTWTKRENYCCPDCGRWLAPEDFRAHVDELHPEVKAKRPEYLTGQIARLRKDLEGAERPEHQHSINRAIERLTAELESITSAP